MISPIAFEGPWRRGCAKSRQKSGVGPIAIVLLGGGAEKGVV